VTPVRQGGAQAAQSGGIVAHLEAEAAVHLEVDEAGSDHGGGEDLGRQASRRGLAPLDLLDDAVLDHHRPGDQPSVDDEASADAEAGGHGR